MVEEALVAGNSTTIARRRVRNRVRLPAVALAVASVGLFAGPAFAGTPAKAKTAKTKTVTFVGHYSGNATLLINNGSVSIPSVTGKGSGTLVGASAVSGSGSSSSSAQCDPFAGKGSIAGAGTRITFIVSKSTSKGCSSGESGPVTVSFNGTAKATSGTGKAKGAIGTLRFTGTLKLAGTTGSQNGTYSVTLTGKLKVKA